MNSLAWLLAACKDAQVRNGPEAVRLSEQVDAATGHGDGNYLDTLDAAYAEVGDFPKAIQVQQKAIEHLPRESWREGYESRLGIYESNQPFRGR